MCRIPSASSASPNVGTHASYDVCGGECLFRAALLVVLGSRLSWQHSDVAAVVRFDSVADSYVTLPRK